MSGESRHPDTEDRARRMPAQGRRKNNPPQAVQADPFGPQKEESYEISLLKSCGCDLFFDGLGLSLPGPQRQEVETPVKSWFDHDIQGGLEFLSKSCRDRHAAFCIQAVVKFA